MSKLFALFAATSASLLLATVAPAADAKPIEPAAVALGRPVDFEEDIYPILESNCIACHNVAINESKLVLEDVESILKGGKRGPSVVPKEPEKSLLYQVAARGKDPVMPPTPNQVGAELLTPQQLGTLRQWILEGATAGAGASSTAMQWQSVPAGMKAIYSVALSPWARFAAAGRANQVYVYDIITGQETGRLIDPNLSSAQVDGKPMYPQGAAHRDFVNALAFSPDGNMIASGGYRAVKLWQRPQNVQKFKLALPEAATAAAVSADGKTLAVAAADNAIQLFNLADGKPGKTLTGHTATITGLAFSPDAAKLFSASHDKTVRAWNVADGAPAEHFETPAPINALALNKEGNRLFTGHADNLIRGWAYPADGQPAAPAVEMKGHAKPVTALAVSPTTAQLVSGSEDGTARLWDPNNGNQVRSLAHGGPVTDVAVRPDGKFIASAGANNVAKLWQADNGQQKAELKGDLSAAHRVVALTDDHTVAKQLVTIADNALKTAEKAVKDREEGLKKATEAKAAADKALAEANEKLKKAQEAVEAAKKELAAKPDDAALKTKVTEAEKAAATETENQKKAQTAAESEERSLKLATEAVERSKGNLEQAKAEKEAAAAHAAKAETDLKAAQAAAAAAEKPLRAVVFSADGKTLATAGDDNLVHLWDAETGAPLETLAGHQAVVNTLAPAGGNLLLSAAADKQAVVWNINPDWQLVGQLGPQKDAPLDLTASPFADRVTALAFSPDGKLLAAGGGEPSRSGELMIWDVAARSLVRKIEDPHSDTVFSVEFSRDGKFLLSGAADKFAKVFDVATGNHVRSYEGHTHHVLGVAWKADGKTIATAGADNAIKVWNVDTGEQQRTITNYSKQVTAIQFIGTSENVVSASGEPTVKFHKTTNGQNYRSFAGSTDYNYAVAASRDEQTVVAGGEDGVLRIWDGTNGKIKRTFDPPKPVEPNQQAAK